MIEYYHRRLILPSLLLLVVLVIIVVINIVIRRFECTVLLYCYIVYICIQSWPKPRTEQSQIT
jgi:Ca2+/Na+ antiporter